MEVSILAPLEGEIPAVKWNYAEFKADIERMIAGYKGAVYTSAQMGQAKADRAYLNKQRDMLDHWRKDIKARFLAPYNVFEAQAKECINLVADCAAAIDAQVKAEDAHAKGEKQEAIRDIYDAWVKELADLLPLEKIMDPRWLNKTYSLDAVEKDIKDKLAQVRGGLAAIDAAGGDFVLEMRATYLDTLDLSAAIAKKAALERQRELTAMREVGVAAGSKAVPTAGTIPAPAAGEKLIPMDFHVEATVRQLAALKQFLKDNHIKYGPVPKQEDK